MTEPNKGGRPQIELTDAQRAEVGELARVGMSKDLIADHLGIVRDTFSAILNRDPATAHVYARGLAEGLAEIHRAAFKEAKAGNPAFARRMAQLAARADDGGAGEAQP